MKNTEIPKLKSNLGIESLDEPNEKPPPLNKKPFFKAAIHHCNFSFPLTTAWNNFQTLFSN